MKKIIATVLAMVMALALCTTAFAAEQKYDVYDAKTGAPYATEVSLVWEKADTYEIAHYELSKPTDPSFNLSGAFASCKAADADYVLYKAGTDTAAMWIEEIEYEYDTNGVAFTKIGEDCGEYDALGDKNHTFTLKDKFYTYTVSKVTYLAVKDEDATDPDAINLLLDDGTVVKCKKLDKLSDLVTSHAWVLDVTKMTAKCSNCTATAKLYESFAEVPAGADYDLVNGYFVVEGKTADTKPADGTSSPKTFDAGIAMYVGMALTSVAGSAVVIGKKKEF